MAEFERQPLGEVLGERGYIRGPFGSALVRHELLDDGIPVYEQQHAITGSREFRFFISDEKFKELSRFQVRPNDLVISCSGTIGKISIIQPNDPMGIISQALLILRPQTNKVLPEFLYYFLTTRDGQHAITQASHGSVQVNIAPRAVVERIEVPVPPIPEQRAIAHILGTLDDKIELNRRRNQTLEAMARALFKDWFVDFGPVRAKCRGGPPWPPMEGQAQGPAPTGWQWPQHILDLFPDRLDDEGKPDGWERKTVGECFSLTMGQSPPGNTYNGIGDGLPFFQGKTDFGFRYPENRKYCSAPIRIANAEDTLVSVRAPVGDINLAWEKCCIGRGVAAVRHASGARSFTYHAIWSLQEELKQFEHTGTVFGAINKKQFEVLPFVEPDQRLIDFYERVCGALDDKVRNNIEESRTLAQLRDTLLPKLISGKLRIEDAEEFLEDAL